MDEDISDLAEPDEVAPEFIWKFAEYQNFGMNWSHVAMKVIMQLWNDVQTLKDKVRILEEQHERDQEYQREQRERR